jgi:hypothetical protein
VRLAGEIADLVVGIADLVDKVRLWACMEVMRRGSGGPEGRELSGFYLETVPS